MGKCGIPNKDTERRNGVLSEMCDSYYVCFPSDVYFRFISHCEVD